MKYLAIKANAGQFKISRLCQSLGVSRSAYYAWLKRKPSQRELDDQRLMKRIKLIFEASYRSYGVPRMRMALRQEGHYLSRERVARLMKVTTCQPKVKKAWRPCTTQANQTQPMLANHLNRDFQATAPHQKWMGDITYIPTKQGFLYLAAVIDLFSRKIVGLAMADHLETSLVETAFKMAWQQEQPGQLAIHHSDRGSQYTSHAHQILLHKKVAQVSMSRKGNCWDSAPIESFWGTLKTECVADPFDSHSQARSEIFAYSMGFYNHYRLHSALDYISPCQFEANYRRRFLCPN